VTNEEGDTRNNRPFGPTRTSSVNLAGASFSGGSRSFGLQIPDASQDALVLAPTIGVRWSGDHLSFGVEPRVEFLVSSQTSWAVIVPLTVSWAWYL
jgi:hypothetical protein